MILDGLGADRLKRMQSSVIREILKAVSKPGMVSLAGGIPAPGSFPMDVMGEITAAVLDKYGARALQYDSTEGFLPLREALVNYLETRGMKAGADDILITTGSQGALDLVGKVFIAKGDRIAVESPTYLGAIQAFTPYEPEFITIQTDEEGIIPEALEKRLGRNQIKLIYLVPTFQNPTGRTLSLERRKEIAAIVKRHGTMLIEDDPYSPLRYRGRDLPSVQSLAPDNTIYVGSLSKIFAPGLRIGFCAAPKQILRWLVVAKQGTDLHTSTFCQALGAEYISSGHLKRHLPKIRALYAPKQKAMMEALESYFPDDFHWSRPDGGMFLWVEGPRELDTQLMLESAVSKNVAFVPGKFFYAGQDGGNECMRLNYTMSDERAIDRAIKTLSLVLKDEMGKRIGRTTREGS